MSEWGWVALGYGVTAGAVSAYLIGLSRRWNRLRDRAEGQR
ncbi:hypothetical protein SZN_33061 [Streptomyces zinciresistens K42]|uniref:Heme exporter protein D n=1 Tax=Streptomyces zinciresistens K42 TaxID=700597 RepID=G2GM60_9ACTN|nr:hypothetical protein [Streptomyces zinciresistens]EGX55407.1 hypothetical protein SZN_33061 [Streptomyces zinciresistens K42]